jgi:pyruvate,water dikinase
MICFLRDLTPAQASLAGGKGRALAQLYQAGYPVPNGFIVLTSTFEDDALNPAAWEQISAALAKLRADQPGCSFAVRSSALSEDSAQASFAGEFETMLDVRDDDSIRRAITAVRQSRHAGRVAAYSRAQGLASPHDVAVVVQQLVLADFSGVLFTADPVTGSQALLVGNYVRGLGEQLVAGEATAAAFTLRRPKGDYAGPPELRRFARQLYRLGVQIERDLGQPQDIEWAIAGGRLALLQARPITTLQGHNPATGEWNDSLTGDYLWTSGNVGEAVPDVMTPCTWSLIQIFIADTMAISAVSRHPLIGNIGGRFYMNLSVLATLAAAFGLGSRRFAEANEQVFGYLPAGMEIPKLPISRWSVIRSVLPVAIAMRRRVAANQQKLPAFIAAAPARCDALHAQIQASSSARDLITLWHAELLPFFRACSHMLEAGARRDGGALVWFRRKLRKLVGETEANALLSGLSTDASQLASLGPLLGLTQLASGAIDRATYARQYGHRGPHEFEVAIARPAEDADWIERQLAGLHEAPVDVRALLARQQEAQTSAWRHFQQRYPRKAASMRRRLNQATAAFRDREAARSEVIRVFWALRAFIQRAGALTGQGDAIFFLSINEILALLAGEHAPLAAIPARRTIYERYSALPTYPALIRGRFDPFQWAADPRRRSDVFDARGDSAPASAAISGFPGAASVVEGRARVLVTADEGDQLEAGEILVTTVTNVGWTPLFPRAAAVVTDVGAPLSHAAIVARELGIPAVVGCGNATMSLHTGDWVRVNGGRGTVEVVRAADEPVAVERDA